MRAVRILIVEDDASLAAGLAQILQGDGHAVDAMKSGEQALLAAGLEHFGLVILDIGLPGIDGFEVDRKSTRLNSSHIQKSRMPSSA